MHLKALLLGESQQNKLAFQPLSFGSGFYSILCIHALLDLNWTTLYLWFAQPGRCNAASQAGLCSIGRSTKTLLEFGKAKTGSATTHLAHKGFVLGKQEEQENPHVDWKLEEPRGRKLWKALAKPHWLDQSTENIGLKERRGVVKALLLCSSLLLAALQKSGTSYPPFLLAPACEVATQSNKPCQNKI